MPDKNRRRSDVFDQDTDCRCSSFKAFPSCHYLPKIKSKRPFDIPSYNCCTPIAAKKRLDLPFIFCDNSFCPRLSSAPRSRYLRVFCTRNSCPGVLSYAYCLPQGIPCTHFCTRINNPFAPVCHPNCTLRHCPSLARLDSQHIRSLARRFWTAGASSPAVSEKSSPCRHAGPRPGTTATQMKMRRRA